MDSIKETLIKRLSEQDSQRDRSIQTNVGPSEIGGCGRRLWYKVNGYSATNDETLRLSAIMGTAIHTMIESVFADVAGFETEVAVTHDGITGHIDLIDVHNEIIWDWKTTTKSGLPYFGNAQQVAQIQIYGYLASKNGYKVRKVGLVGIPRDGNENDVVEMVFDYDEATALKALATLDTIRGLFDPPREEKEASYCAKYCSFYGLCDGIVEPDTTELITNEETLGLIRDYQELQVTSKETSAQLDFIKEALSGTTGKTPNGVVIKWSKVSGRQTIDESAVLEALGYVPKKQGSGYERITIK